MDEAEDSSDEGAEGQKTYSQNDKEIIWSVGDECQAKWSGDSKLYTGVVKKLRHVHTTERVVALVKFTDYNSDDCEEVDAQKLQRVVGVSDSDRQNERRDKAEDRSNDNGKSGGGFFNPLTGQEDISRLEDKYGHESDSDSEEMSDSNQWISPTPYQTKGKVSDWKIRSSGRVANSVSPCHKAPVVQMRSPRKRSGVAGGRTDNVQTERKEKSTVSDDSAYATSAGETSTFRSSVEGTIRKGDAQQSSARYKTDDSAFRPTDKEGLFGGFDDDDMEKPKFSFSAPSEKIPFCLEESQNVQIPAPLNQYLRDYQREGVAFLYSHYRHNRGAVLGDDMGLGKTVQVIAFLSALMGKQGNRRDVLRQKPRFIRLVRINVRHSRGAGGGGQWEEGGKVKGPVLVIGPGGVLYNWLEELDTWGHFTVRKYHGTDKASCLIDVGRGKVEVVVTTFETCRDNIDALNKVKWDAVIVDEVHRIKGLKAQTTQSLRTLRCLRRYGLTGTALQNSMAELWCILDWAQPNVLGQAEDFGEDFVRPIEHGQKQNATKRELAVARKKKEEFAAVRNGMMIRRTKKVIADQLPVKRDEVVFCRLAPLQIRDRVVFCRLAPLQVSVYKAVLAHPDLKTVLRLNQKCDCGSGNALGRCCYKKVKSARSPQSVMFTFLHVLLKTSNHIALLTPHGKMSPEQAKQARRLCDVAFRDHPEFMELARDAAFRTLSDPQYCGKMKVLHGMLSVFAKDHSKVLVFSYSTRLLDILEQHIMSEGLDYRRIDGSVTGRRRQEIVREFNANPDIFLCLVSTKAGGLGLNMTGANKVVIFDPNWNPSHDLQAQDRAYRIGQRRDVEVYRLISAGSIEENIYLRQIYKQQLDNIAIGTENARRYFEGIQGDSSNQGELFGIRNMFQLRTGDSCLTMDILNRNAKVEAGVAGHEMADYIPSWRERHSTEGDSTEEEEEDRRRGDESSDEDTLQAFKDLFDAGSDEEEKKEKPQRAANRPTKDDSDPTPSTSGLHVRRTAPAGAHSTGLPQNDSDPESEHNPRSSRPTTRQRKLPKTAGSSGSLFDETSATEALTFLWEGEGERSGGKKGKAPRRGKGKERGGVLSGRKKSKTPQVPLTSEEDSLVTPSFSSVSSVFEKYGVVHIHDNTHVVGASRVEDHMTRCAMHDVFELSANTQAPALCCDPMSQPSEAEAEETRTTPALGRRGQRGRGTRGRTASKDHNSARSVDHGRWHILVGQTPSAIRKKQWSQLKELKKDQDEITLARTVLLASPEERLSLLKEMYKRGQDESLHETLDTILVKPSEPSQDTGGGGTARRQETAAKTGPARRQTKAGQKKRNQSKAAPRKKAAARGKGKTRGLLYDDTEDTQLTQVRPRASSTTAAPKEESAAEEEEEEEEDSGFDFGASVSPARVKALQNRRRSSRSRQTQRSSVSASLFDRDEEGGESVSRRKESWKTADDVKSRNPEVDRSLETEDVDGLLSELGRNPGDEDCDVAMNQDPPDVPKSSHSRGGKRLEFDADQNRDKPKLSVLDDIFGETDDSQQKKRKPPPKRGRKRTQESSNLSSASDNLTDTASGSGLQFLTGSHTTTDSRKRSATSSSEIFSDLMNNSTLRDDDIDCFGEPSQWKRRPKRKTPVSAVDRLLQKSSDDYFQLLASGRLVKKRPKKRPKEKAGDVAEEDAGYPDIMDVCEGKGGKESSDLDLSASLFG
ncbi:hypothetical protein ACOMHN_040514 [Nucella lapillus]